MATLAAGNRAPAFTLVDQRGKNAPRATVHRTRQPLRERRAGTTRTRLPRARAGRCRVTTRRRTRRCPAAPVASGGAVRSAISTASSPVTPSFAGRGSASRRRSVTSASARSPSACTTSCVRQASRMRGLRCPSAATPKPPVRSSSSRPSCNETRQPSALRPDHVARPNTRPTVARAIVPAIAVSCSLRSSTHTTARRTRGAPDSAQPYPASTSSVRAARARRAASGNS